MVYIVMLLYSVQCRIEHASFLNNIVRLDRKLATLMQNMKSVNFVDNNRMYFGQMLVHTFGYSAIYLTIMIWGDSMTFDLIPLWHNELFKLVGIVFMTSRCMVAMHMRWCAILLRRQRSIINDLMAQSNGQAYPILMAAMKDVNDLKRSFQQIFGFAIALNTFNDFMLIVVLVYMSLMYVLTSRAFDWRRLAKLMLMLSLPCGKLLLFISGVDGLGADRIGQLCLIDRAYPSGNRKSVMRRRKGF